MAYTVRYCKSRYGFDEISPLLSGVRRQAVEYWESLARGLCCFQHPELVWFDSCLSYLSPQMLMCIVVLVILDSLVFMCRKIRDNLIFGRWRCVVPPNPWSNRWIHEVFLWRGAVTLLSSTLQLLIDVRAKRVGSVLGDGDTFAYYLKAGGLSSQNAGSRNFG